MAKFLYKKAAKKNLKKISRPVGLVLLIIGFLFGAYTIFPLLSWEIYIKPVFANQTFAAPIPKNNLITQEYIRSLLENSVNSFQQRDFTNAQNWLPNSYKSMEISGQLSEYSLTIPKLKIQNAEVGTADTDLAKHLVHFPGTAIPGNKGTAVIFGHSTLPQLYNPKDYTTILAYAHTLTVDNTFLVTAENTTYTYKIYDISITDPTNLSYLTQDFSGHYLTLVTCTPPGTTWKRLIIKAKLETI
jgi:sortase A